MRAEKMIGDPQIMYREQRLSMGIRTIAPFRGMFAHRDDLFTELRLWVQKNDIAEEGPYFLRYHVIDMDNQMDIEVGYVVSRHLPAEGRVKPGSLPAGNYASLTYSRYGLRANKALITWAKENGIRWDRWEDPAGDAFRCRYEAYLTDYRLEPRKSQWMVELAIKIADR
jgi:effector-binding domain-containing protein